MHANNIALFDEACSLIFTKLYSSFPIPLDFDQRDIGFYNRSDLSEDTTLRRRVLTETLKFLHEEGFIVFSNTESDLSTAIRNARLTTKGLMKLSRIPCGIQQDSKPLIEQLSNISANLGDKSSTAVVSAAIGHIMRQILG